MRASIISAAILALGVATLAQAQAFAPVRELAKSAQDSPSQVPPKFYVTMVGQKTGKIIGEVTSGPHKDQIAGIAYSHSIISPRDIQSGLPTGQRQHKPLIITKERGAASPLLMNVLCTNENLTKVQIDFVRPNAAGAEENYLTIILTNANIASIDSRIPVGTNTSDKPRDYEEIAMTYQKITITSKPGNITATDDWEMRQ